MITSFGVSPRLRLSVSICFFAHLRDEPKNSLSLVNKFADMNAEPVDIRALMTIRSNALEVVHEHAGRAGETESPARNRLTHHRLRTPKP